MAEATNRTRLWSFPLKIAVKSFVLLSDSHLVGPLGKMVHADIQYPASMSFSIVILKILNFNWSTAAVPDG